MKRLIQSGAVGFLQGFIGFVLFVVCVLIGIAAVVGGGAS